MTGEEAVDLRNEAEEEIRNILCDLATKYAGTPYKIEGLRGDIHTVDTTTKDDGRAYSIIGQSVVEINLADTRLKR